jgi:predicted transcriptional regulator
MVTLFNRLGDRPVDDDRAAQDEDLDLTSTVRATILAANAKGVGEQRIADELGITRHRVRKFLGNRSTESQPAATINGHDLGEEQHAVS